MDEAGSRLTLPPARAERGQGPRGTSVGARRRRRSGTAPKRPRSDRGGLPDGAPPPPARPARSSASLWRRRATTRRRAPQGPDPMACPEIRSPGLEGRGRAPHRRGEPARRPAETFHPDRAGPHRGGAVERAGTGAAGAGFCGPMALASRPHGKRGGRLVHQAHQPRGRGGRRSQRRGGLSAGRERTDGAPAPDVTPGEGGRAGASSPP